MQVLPHELVPELDEIYNEFVLEVFSDPNYIDNIKMEDLLKMYKICPYNGLSIRFLALRAAGALGEYHHADPKLFRTSTKNQTLQEWVKSNFQTMRGSLRQSIKKMLNQALCIGHSVGEIVNTSTMPGHKGEWRLWKIKVLNPCRYSFAGKDGEWDRIIYNSRRRGRYPIPRQKLIHICIPDIDEPEHPSGCGLALRGYPYYKARQLTLKAWSDRMVRNSLGTTVIKGDSNVTVTQKDILGETILGADGKPLKRPALEVHVERAAKARDGSVLGLPKEFDYMHYPGTSGTGADYNMGLTRYGDDIWIAYGIPKTIFAEGSAVLGQAGLNMGHRLILDTQIEDIIEMIRNQILEMVIRPLLASNFGIRQQDDFGTFKTDVFLPAETANMRANLISTGMLQGIIESDDLSAINQFRRDCGLEPVTTEDFNKLQVKKMIEAQIKQQQEQAMQQQEEK